MRPDLELPALAQLEEQPNPPTEERTMATKNTKKTTEPNVTVIRTEVRPLPVVLTEAELLERGQQLADTETRQREHESHSEAVKKELKSKEQAISSERSRLAGIVKAKAEPREVRVSIESHSKERMYVEVREDTGEVVFRRPLRPEEMQAKLDLDDAVLAVVHPADPGQIP